MYDARVVANYILDFASERGVQLSNLALQKLLFFAHSMSLIENKKTLVNGFFEAWQYGPVHPVVYQAFKENDAKVISSRAKKTDPVTREVIELEKLLDLSARGVCETVVLRFGKLSPAILVDLTHADGGAWDCTVKNSKEGANIGLRISNEIIIEKQNKPRGITLSSKYKGRHYEDKPFARNRFG